MKRSISIPTDTLWQAGFLLLTPFTAAWLMQFTYGVLPWAMLFPALLANALCIALLYWPLCGLTGRIAPCCIGIHIASGAWGAANCFVQSFRGTPILPWDLSALGTAADVAGSYRFTPTWQMLAAVALAAALVVFLHPEKHKARLRLTGTRRPLRLVCLGAGLACLLLLFPTGRLERFGVKTDVWDPAGSYRAGGCLAVFLRNTEFLEVEEPEDVTPERLEQIMAGVEPPEPAAVSVERPNIVAIMNESWADFEDYGNLTLSASVTNYIRSLDNAVYGHAYTSVFGAGTSASEFEFLTGNSMAFLPSGSIPYQQYVLGPTASLASILKAEGYSTLAFHPGERASWQRDRAYPRLGFDSYKCGDDMDVPQTFEHGYVSDQSDFEQIIWELEHKEEGKPLFLFNVTIQNHGGYTVPDYPAQVTVADAPGEYPMAEQYLTLAGKTDAAFRALVEYLRVFDEPTIVIMFGDHQPSVEDGFFDEIAGQPSEQVPDSQRIMWYETPFLIWTNYEMKSEDKGPMGAVYLSSEVLKRAGLSMTPFNQFMLEMEEQLPVIHPLGCYDRQGNYYTWEAVAGEQSPYRKLISDYQCLVYNHCFDANTYEKMFTVPGT
mgnify:CR=1 FL=1